jgi:hypothetical protein
MSDGKDCSRRKLKRFFEVTASHSTLSNRWLFSFKNQTQRENIQLWVENGQERGKNSILYFHGQKFGETPCSGMERRSANIGESQNINWAND